MKRVTIYHKPFFPLTQPIIQNGTLQRLPRPTLAPSHQPQHRHNSTTTTTSTTTTPIPSTPSPPPPFATLTPTQRSFLTSALRVNQAGELAATHIYTSQTPPLVTTHPHLAPLLKHMHAQEASHFAHFNTLLARHRIRPTALSPLWILMSKTLGWSTGLLGREASMACTEAVETEIGNHYNSQVRELYGWMTEAKEKGEVIDAELMELIDSIKRIRDEELEHLDHAVENDAKEAKPYELLTWVIRGGCRGAIWVSERV